MSLISFKVKTFSAISSGSGILGGSIFGNLLSDFLVSFLSSPSSLLKNISENLLAPSPPLAGKINPRGTSIG